MALAGALACQKDSYLTNISTKVVSCQAATISLQQNGKKNKVNCFEVILEDTVIFPEGGGQPEDKGTINGHDVLGCVRRGGNAIHYLPVALDAGQQVELCVDWTRRWDHMQQHSGQHLVTAVADNMFGFATTSWNLGDKTSFIELDTPSMTVDQMVQVEEEVNSSIRAGLKMYPTLYESISDPKLKEVRTRGLPDDHVGPVRVVTIETIETNMCCGTHVRSLSHLQNIKLLAIEKGKKGRTNLVFVAGDRVLQYLGRCYEKEKAITSLLKGGPDIHVELLQKLQASFKVAQKSATILLRDVAILEAAKFHMSSPRKPYFFLHRKEGDNEFMNLLVNEINDPSVVMFLSTGDEKGVGLFMLAGNEDLITELGMSVAELIEGKGAGKKGRYQGRANKLSKRPQVEQMILEKLACCGDS